VSDCDVLHHCPIWASFHSHVKAVWISNYCKGSRRERCARLQLIRAGQPVAADLLPNGTRMPVRHTDGNSAAG
jgi:hypothetical protein